MQPINFNYSNKDYLKYVQKMQNAEINLLQNNDYKDNGKKIKMALAGFATVGIAITTGILIYKGKFAKLSNITFDNGKALTKKGQPFSGVIKKKFSNGDNAKLIYENGTLISSKRTGKINFSKTYKTMGDSNYVTITNSNGTKTINLTELAEGKLKLKQKQEAEAKLKLELKQKQEHEAKIRREAINREIKEIRAEMYASEAQEKFNAPFKNALANKPAKESAQVFKKEYAIQEAKKRTIKEIEAEKLASEAQEKFNAPFKNALANKPAKESAMELLGKKTKNSETIPVFDNHGNHIKNITKTKKGLEITEILDADGKVTERRIYDKIKDTSITTKHGYNAKTIETTCEDSTGTTKRKIYVKENGKLKSIGRQSYNPKKGYYKNVEYLKDGTSKTTIVKNNSKKIIYRDKKGNIIRTKEFDSRNPVEPPMPPSKKGFSEPSHAEQEILAEWYVHYMKLCKKYNVNIRPCGVPGGAGDHYFELLKREEGPGAWMKYLKTEAMRTQYDENARLMQFLRENEGENVYARLGYTEETSDWFMDLDVDSFFKLAKREMLPKTTYSSAPIIESNEKIYAIYAPSYECTSQQIYV